MVIRQGDVFWIDLEEPVGSGPGYLRPHVVIQNDMFNSTRLNTAIVCAITSNLVRAGAAGNVTLKPGEANLPKPSVVNVSHILTVDKQLLVDRIGTLSRDRIRQILNGIALYLEPTELP